MIEHRPLGSTGPKVSAYGLGLMGMSNLYGPSDRAESIATFHQALDAGINLLDTGDFYGMGHNELLIAEGLKGKLLILHGTGDDNVHFQGNQKLINRLVELGKQFDFMEYPNRTHGISEGRGTTLHVYNLIARYFETHLPAGGR